MPSAREPLYRRHRFPPEVISYAVWLYFRFPLSLRMVEEIFAARGICVTYETVRQWGKKFGWLCCKDDRRRWEDGDKLDPISRCGELAMPWIGMTSVRPASVSICPLITFR
jgi:transposase-like protein